MNNKERCIKAIHELIKKQKEGTWVPGKEECPLCKIFNKKPLRKSNFPCKGCPVANYRGNPGCINYNSYWTREEEEIFLDKENNELFRYKSTTRALFWIKKLPEIMTWPKERFTKKGWKYQKIPDIIDGNGRPI